MTKEKARLTETLAGLAPPRAVFRRHVEPADWRGFPVGGFIDERHARQVIKNSINITAEHSAAARQKKVSASG